MTRILKSIALCAAAIMIASALFACTTSGAGGPTLQPAAVTTTASPAPDAGYKANDKPFANLQTDSINRIRIIQYSDAQPPNFPDPYKDVITAADLQKLVNILNGVTIKSKVDNSRIPVGATGYSLLVNEKSGEVLLVHLYGDYDLSEPNQMYEIKNLPDMGALFIALTGRTRLLPDTANTVKKMNSCLFEIDGWRYYLEPQSSLVRQNDAGTVEIVDKLVDTIHFNMYQENGRILFSGYQSDTSRDVDMLVSINTDGSDRRAFAAKTES